MLKILLYLPSDFLKTLISHFDTEYGETAKRAYRLLATMNERLLISRNLYANNVYQTYASAGMKEDFVARDISERIGGHYYGNFIDMIGRAKSQMQGNRKELSGLSEAFAYYENLIDQEIRLSQNKRTQDLGRRLKCLSVIICILPLMLRMLKS